MNDYHCAICGSNLGEIGDVAECPNCHTVFDFRARKVDRSRTMVAPMDCKHRRRIFVESSRGMGQNHHVTICADCGEMRVSGTTEAMGDSFDVRLVLWSRDLIDALAKAAAFIEQEEAQRKGAAP